MTAREREPVGVYVHVPFCVASCGYCDFCRVDSPAGVPEGYEDLVVEEARLYAREPQLRADTLYLGGGTPSLLEPERLRALIEGIRSSFAFTWSPEVTLEANPETVDPSSLEGWRDAGVTRLSVGVQSFDASVLGVLGRRASLEKNAAALLDAVEAGFAHLSADLMTGVPGQSLPSLRKDLSSLAALPLDHVSVYALDLHGGTRLHAAVLRGELSLPGEDAAAEMLAAAHEVLCERGFEHYEISNFARPGGECRHNLKYWRCAETVGLGPSAWSRFDGRLTENRRDIQAWAAAVRRGERAVESEQIISLEQHAADRVIFGLRLAEGVDEELIHEVVAWDGRDPAAVVSALTAHGYAELEGGRLHLTPLGFMTSNEVLTYLLPDR